MPPKKTKSSQPTRPPVKAKSALPAPRVSTKRVHIPWHQRRTIQALIGLVLLAVVVFGVIQGRRFWHHHTVTAHNKTAVKAFDTAFQADLTPLGNFLTQAQNAPPQYIGGLMPLPTYTSQTAQWLATTEALRTQISNLKAPGPLAKAQAEIVQATDVLIDGVKAFQLAGTTTDKTAASTLVQQGTNTLSHGLAVLEDGATEEETVVHDYGLPLPSGVTPSSLTATPQAPPEVQPLQSPTPASAPSPSPS
jgi:hypothetical protein